MKTIDKVIDQGNNIVNYIIYILLAISLLFGGYSLWDMFKVFDGTKLDQEILKYRPGDDEKLDLEKLQKINPDICAWIRVNNTKIDYPVVKGKNNYEYLNLDYKKNYSLSGSIFLDYRNKIDFTDKHNVVYGHNINGNLMFADVRAFRLKNFFDTHQEGYLFTKEKTYKLDIFAYLDVNTYNSTVYNVGYSSKELSPELIDFIKNKSDNYREIDLKKTDRIIMLSTCYGDGEDRSVAVAKILE